MSPPLMTPTAATDMSVEDPDCRTSDGHLSSSVPIGLRVYASCSQGGRKYMEDYYDLKYQFNAQNELQFIYLAIFDGHGGDVAAKYARQWLCHNIVRQRGFWSRDDDNAVLQAIRKGFIQTHYDMRKVVLNWPKTASGLPSTSGTTSSIVFIMNGKYYTGHVGDSRIVLGRKHEATGKWMSSSLTRDHKPESPREKRRIEAAGGQVMNKSGVDRVVWNRPKLGHKGPVRRSTSFDQIPFLAVARSLGDLWSFNSELNTFIVSPEPDLKCIPIDANDQCLLLASDGLWNMMTTQTAVKVLQEVEEDQYSPELIEAVFDSGSTRLSPSRALVHFCLNRWYQSRFRADNTTVVAVMIEDNQGIHLSKSNQNLPMNGLFSDSDDDSDDGYDDSLDGIDFFNNFYNDRINGNDINGKAMSDKTVTDISSSEVSSTTPSSTTTTTIDVNTATTDPTVPHTNHSSNATELQDNTRHCPQNDDNNQTIVLTPLVNVSTDYQMNNNNNKVIECLSATTTGQTDLSAPVMHSSSASPIDETDSQSNESSRDSGTASPPTPTVIAATDELTEEEYAALPSLVNLSQNEWELYVVIDPKNLSVNSNDLNAVSISGEENSYLMEGQSSLANINKVIEDNTALNHYIYSKTGFLGRHRSPAGAPTNSIMNGTDLMLTTADNYWSESNGYYNPTTTAIKPYRSSLPLGLVDNHSSPVGGDANYTPIISANDQKSSSMVDTNNLCIFGALKSCAMKVTTNGTDGCDDSLQKLTKIFSESNNNNDLKSNDTFNGDRKKRTIFRHSRLLRRIIIDSNGAKVRSPLLAAGGLKRKACSPSDYSPPSKHLRSSLWTRPMVSKEHLMRMSFTRSLKQLAVGRLTRSRLRPIKLLKSFASKK